MPAFDLRYIQAAELGADGKYSNKTKIGDAMTASLDLTFAEGRLYAESALAEFMRKATGGSISLGVKYILDEAQKMLFKAKESTRTISGSSSIKGLKLGTYSTGQYVGVSFYCPDLIDGVEKFSCVFVPKALFGPPSMSRQTMGQNITFDTPTTTGEFLKDANEDLLETATADTEADAKAWCDAVLASAT